MKTFERFGFNFLDFYSSFEGDIDRITDIAKELDRVTRKPYFEAIETLSDKFSIGRADEPYNFSRLLHLSFTTLANYLNSLYEQWSLSGLAERVMLHFGLSPLASKVEISLDENENKPYVITMIPTPEGFKICGRPYYGLSIPATIHETGHGVHVLLSRANKVPPSGIEFGNGSTKEVAAFVTEMGYLSLRDNGGNFEVQDNIRHTILLYYLAAMRNQIAQWLIERKAVEMILNNEDLEGLEEDAKKVYKDVLGFEPRGGIAVLPLHGMLFYAGSYVLAYLVAGNILYKNYEDTGKVFPPFDFRSEYPAGDMSWLEIIKSYMVKGSLYSADEVYKQVFGEEPTIQRYEMWFNEFKKLS